jgi:hypothetical protein
MDVVPASIGAASRAWDEQNLDVTAAGQQIGGAPTGGFTDAVSGTASRFATTWQRHATDLADQAEARADGLRTSLADYLRTDRSVGLEHAVLQGYLTEVR